MQRHVLATPHAHAQLQPFEPIQSAHAFPIHQPALPSQQHPDPLIAKARSRVRELANAQAKRRLIRRLDSDTTPRG